MARRSEKIFRCWPTIRSAPKQNWKAPRRQLWQHSARNRDFRYWLRLSSTAFKGGFLLISVCTLGSIMVLSRWKFKTEKFLIFGFELLWDNIIRKCWHGEHRQAVKDFGQHSRARELWGREELDAKLTPRAERFLDWVVVELKLSWYHVLSTTGLEHFCCHISSSLRVLDEM